MIPENDNHRLMQDVSMLYELSLAIGHSVDLEENVRYFSRVLMSRLQVDIFSLWLHADYLPENQKSDGYQLVYASPKFRQTQQKIADDNWLVKQLKHHSYLSCSYLDPEYAWFITETGIHKGIYVLFKLADLGFVKLYQFAPHYAWTEQEMSKLSKVFRQFAKSIHGCIDHRDLLHETIRRKQTERQLQERLDFEDLLLEISSSFIHSDQTTIDEKLHTSLAQIGQYTKADRSYIFEYDEELMSNTYEWCYEGITCEKETLQKLSKSVFPWWNQKIENYESIIIPDVAKLPPEAEVEKKTLQRQQIKSVVVVPMTAPDGVMGFAGFDFVQKKTTFTDDMVKLLIFVGQIFSKGLQKKNIAEESLDSEHFNDLFPIQNILSKAGKKSMIYAYNHFMANTNHEMRTPVHAINGLLSLMRETSLDPEQKGLLDKLEFSAGNLTLLLDNLFVFKKIKEKPQKETVSTHNISQLLDKISGMFVYKARENNISLYTHVDKRVAQNLKIPYASLQRIILNLIDNAIKFNAQGRSGIRVHVRDDTETSQLLRFSVEDDGMGLPFEMESHVKEKLIFPEHHLKKTNEGSGIGLFISENLVKNLGGKLEILPNKPKGTIISFELRFEKGADSSSESQSLQSAHDDSFEGLKVLLVEDNKINQLVGAKILNSMGIECEIASNGLMAIEKLKENSYDVVLMDIMMPKMDGIEATRIIRNELNQSVPIIACTAKTSKEDQKTYTLVGMNDFIAKPFDAPAIEEVLLRNL
jgi:signal transduction histidine kinase